MLAISCVLVLYTRVVVSFDRVRVTVVRAEQPAVRGSVRAPLPDLSGLAGGPAALIVRVDNRSPSAREIRLSLDGTEVARLTVPANRATRNDISLSNEIRISEGNALEFRSDADDWTVQYVEIANIHGFSSGLFSFVIVPPTADPPATVPTWMAAAVLALLLLPPAGWFRLAGAGIAKWIYRGLATVVLLFFAAAVVSPLVSSYQILIAIHTFVVCALIVYFPVLERIGRVALRGTPADPPLTTTDFRTLAPYLVCGATAILFLASVAQFHEPEYGFTSLISFGDEFHDDALPRVRAVPHHVIEDSSGYDGQFYAQMAVDPLLRDPGIEDALDNVQYRGRRIFFAWTAFVLGLGQPAWILQAYAVQNIVFWALLGLVLFRWLPPRNIKNSLLWSACMFSHGLVICVRSALPDGPSLLFHTAAVVAVEQNRLLLASGLVGVSGLAKDINLLAAPVLARADAAWRQIRVDTYAWMAVLLAVPLLLWIAYIFWLGHDLSRVAGISNFAIPLSGYVDKWQATIAELARDGWDSYARFSLCALIGLGTQAFVLVRLADWKSPWWRAAIASVALMVLLGPNVWDGYPGAATRVLLPMTFAFNILLPRNRWFWPLFVLGNLSVVPGFDAVEAGRVIERYLLV